MRSHLLAVLALSLNLMPALTSSAAEPEGGVPAAAPAAQPEPTPEQKAAMDAWLKATSPGPAHAVLEPLVGTFSATVNYWMAPGQPPIVTTGTSTNQWVLGGRHLEQRFEGISNGQPFSGIGYTGHDNVQGAYVGTWMDNMSTSIMSITGKAEGNVLTFRAVNSDPMTGKVVEGRQRTEIKSADEHVLEMWLPGPDGKEYRAMEIVYKRK